MMVVAVVSNAAGTLPYGRAIHEYTSSRQRWGSIDVLSVFNYVSYDGCTFSEITGLEETTEVMVVVVVAVVAMIVMVAVKTVILQTRPMRQLVRNGQLCLAKSTCIELIKFHLVRSTGNLINPLQLAVAQSTRPSSL
jgi:hypothetical protein